MLETEFGLSFYCLYILPFHFHSSFWFCFFFAKLICNERSPARVCVCFDIVIVRFRACSRPCTSIVPPPCKSHSNLSGVSRKIFLMYLHGACTLSMQMCPPELFRVVTPPHTHTHIVCCLNTSILMPYLEAEI